MPFAVFICYAHRYAKAALVHRNQEVIGIDAPYIRALNLVIQKRKDVRWSQTNRFWYLPFNRQSHRAIVEALAAIDETLLRT